jgi:hypothetical protein
MAERKETNISVRFKSRGNPDEISPGTVSGYLVKDSGQSPESTLVIANPVGGLASPILSPSPRLTDLNGKTIGLYVSKKANVFEFLAQVAKRLKEQFPAINIIGGVEGTIWAKPSYDREGDIDALAAQNPDAIIMAISS